MIRSCIALLLSAPLLIAPAAAATIYTTGFETGIFPPPDYAVGGYGTIIIADDPDGLPNPAGGYREMRITAGSVNFGLAIPTGHVIQAHASYVLSAAIGHESPAADASHWSLQLWSGSSATDGGLDSFIAQQFGTSGTSTTPAVGEWALNAVSFNSDDYAGLVGRQIVLLLNTYSSGSASDYDNVLLTETVTAVPEPATSMLLAAGLAAFAVYRRRA